MRNKHLLLALAALAMGPAVAGAAMLDQLTATADCNAWGAEATITFRPGARAVLLVFSVQLADSNGVELERYDDERWLEIPTVATVTYPYGASWQSPLDQRAVVTVFAQVYDTRGDSFNITSDEVVVAVDCTPPDDDTPDQVCRHASRWWLRHRADWPVQALTLGGVTYEQRQLERLLRQPHRGLVGRRLAHQLAVAKLNLANGVANDVESEVAAADAWLANYPLELSGRHREPRHNERRQALRLIKDLHRWNHGGCPEGVVLIGDSDDEIDKEGLTFDFGGADMEFTGDMADYDETDKAAEETTSLGTLKAMYR
ncbi:MAG: hypothetical protein IPK64_03120 [bacterium]|nr:hypothetical protein [bacterium]